MPKPIEKDIQGLLPNLKGLEELSPRAAFRLEEAFRRIYEILMLRLSEQNKSFNSKLEAIDRLHKQEIENLKSFLSQPLAGSTEPDLILQSVISSYGPQSPNHFLGGPIPSFRAITLADLPNIAATQLNADGEILDINQILDGEYIRRIGNTIVGGVPVGTTNLKEGTLDDAEANLYTTPLNHRTKMRHVLLFNNTAGTLNATIKARDAANIQIFTQDFPLLSQEKIIATLNLILPFDYKLNGFSSVEGAIEYSLFGIEEPLI